MDHILLCLTVLCLHFMSSISTSVSELYLGNSTCSMKTYEANEKQFYEIVWGGEKLPRHCKIGFVGRNKKDIFDQYSLCAEVVTYKVHDCAFEMVYYEQKQYSKQIARTYHCDITPEKYCSKPDKDFDIEFKNRNKSSSKVRILISAIKTYDYKSSLVGAVVGGILAGMVILAVIIIGIVFLRIRKRPKPVLIPDPDRETRV